MPGGTKAYRSVLSMAQSNGVAGPRGVAPPTAPRGPKRSTNSPCASMSQAQTNSIKASLSNTSAARPPAANPLKNAGDPAQLTSQFAGMSVNDNVRPKAQTYDPSNGPSPSMLTVATGVSRPFSAAPSYRDARSQGGYNGPVKTKVCTLTRNTRQTFSRGDIISVPVHKTNRNPSIDLSDKHLTQTKIGGVYSKRRMVVILWKSYDSLFCVPLHSYNRTGLQKKPYQMKHEFVCVKNEADENFKNQGLHEPVEAVCKHPLDRNTVIPLGDHVEVGYRDDIATVGEMTTDGFIYLLALWEQVVAQAKKEPRRHQGCGTGGHPMRGMPAIME